ncbi:hypothetical protein K8I85_02630 [bacterium]|nr:hypothetical protein [bacterium]
MGIVNAIFRQIFDLLLLPFAALPYWVGVTVLGCLLSVGMLWVYKKTSDQDRIDKVKARIFAGIFEIRLYNDDLRAIFRAQGTILRNNLQYFGLSLVPLAWMIIPMVLMIGQLNHHYGYDGLAPGEETLLKVELADGWREHFADLDGDARPPAELGAPDGVTVEGPAYWFPSRETLVWKVRVDRRGHYEVAVHLGEGNGGETYLKTLDATTRIRRRSPVRHAGAFLDQIMRPAEQTLPKDALVHRMEIAYPAHGITVDVANRVWLMFLVSIVFAFVIKDKMGVKI